MKIPPTTEQGLIQINQAELAESPELYLKQKADQGLAMMLGCAADDYQQIKTIQDQLISIGQVEQQAIWRLNDRLKHPLQKMMNDSRGGGQVTLALQELQREVEQIKPPKKTWVAGFLNLFKLLFSWKESAWQMWLEAYPEHKQNITHILNRLKQFKQQLNRDNRILLADQQEMASRINDLQPYFDMVSLWVDKFKTDLHIDHNPPKTLEMLHDEFMPTIQQRLIELQQQLLIARQTVMTIELFIKQNKAHLQGIRQAVNTTVQVIDVTASLAMLENGQKGIEHLNHKNKQLKSVADTNQLKQARQVVDKAMEQIDNLQQASEQATEQAPLKQRNSIP